MKKKSAIKNQQSKISFWHPASLVCTVFGIGKLRPAPGTWGSLVGVVFFVIYPQLALLAVVPLFFIGAAAANHYSQITQSDDASEIVIDEVVGQWIAIFIGFSAYMEFFIEDSYWYLKLVIFFLTFRFFDIVKPFPVGWVDRNIKGGLGVMLDDVVAGVLAGITSALIFWLITLI